MERRIIGGGGYQKRKWTLRGRVKIVEGRVYCKLGQYDHTSAEIGEARHYRYGSGRFQKEV